MEPATPFDLNEATRRWRDELCGSPAFAGKDLEELEGHLRDSVADLAGRGLFEEEAFLIASRRLGAAPALTREYGRVHAERVWVERSIWMIVGWLAVWGLSNVASLAGSIASLVANAWLPSAWWTNLSGVLGYVGTLAVAAVLIWRGMTQGTGVARSAGGSLAARPLATALLAVVFMIVLVAGSMFSTVVVARLQPPDTFATAQQWRQGSILAATLVLYPALLGWLLARRARHQAATR